ncbi:MAG: PTS sugar transporter subunit IIA [Erysipelotrichales bacterium]|nr:PTS sugar transporter subunit IIA [Erysipelotrichales bacterium]MBQ2310295.1 PTS sugar transporter subunit IIA [Erysipelotrichales bacterium]MBQ2477904.1 PTS sugar transporter subunit IIA [Erysipelotrichales bacterium]MBQ4374943.1 PTS sugar transporter subunit IIA [Erysipelotrichales bacterium]MBQ5542226.1 PTS sugar transporter subunit IIA [Erysipelotrichales bacterium]
MIQDLIKLENCVVLDEVSDWKEAIHAALAPLVKDGCCTDEYEQAVLDMTAQIGPYYVLTEHMALIHASSEAGVHKTQLACTVLKKPVAFTEEKNDVRVLVALCATDSTSHMDGIVAVSQIFGDEDKELEMMNSTSAQEIYDLFISNADAEE